MPEWIECMMKGGAPAVPPLSLPLVARGPRSYVAAMRAAIRSIAIALFLGASVRAQAQFVTRPALDWRTTETEHFSVHYPSQYREWSRAVAGRLDSARTVVGGLVGFVPDRGVQVLVDDPVNAPNGFALPFLDRPTMVFFPVPPTPRQFIGNSRDWGEMLAVHEFAHLAHLTWPSRAPLDLGRLLPVPVSPILRRAPRWVTEGFATYVEGRVTGSGRPYNAQRAAVLRQWALDGRLPTYGQMSGWNAYHGGAFAYLMGSAYLEWLGAREGDSTIAHLWRRMTARTSRTFPRAFAGVYGRGPDALYGRFTAELTGDALAVERAIDSLGGVLQGELVQRVAWETGDPALSPDGSRIAVVLRSATRPGRVVVWRTGPDSVPPHALAARDSARARARRRDPLDVPDRQFFPPPKRPVAVLEPRDGRAFDAPRFMPDGKQLLVSHAEPVGDGAFRPDLHLWDIERDATRRVTRGAAVRQADPAPDGRTAAAVQCLRGWCDLVRVHLADGRVEILREGSPSVSFYRPRHSPDGTRIAVAEQRDDRWQIVIVDARDPSRAADALPRDDGNRFDAAWIDDRTLVAVSDASGIANLERIDLEARTAQPFTRVTGAVFAPEVRRRTGEIWFLSLHPRGLDLHRMPAPHAPLVLPTLDSALFPVVPGRPATPAPALPIEPVAPDVPYGIGPRHTRWFPGFTSDASGVGASLLLINGDPVGRLELAVVGAMSASNGWRGGRAWASLHRWRPTLTTEVFAATERQGGIDGMRPLPMNGDVAGAGVRAAVTVHRSAWRVAASFGGAAMRLRGDAAGDDQTARQVGWAGFDLTGWRRILGTDVTASVHALGDAGRHAGADVGHLTTRVTAGLDLPFVPPIRASVLHARDASDSAAAPFERVVVGGAGSPILDATLLPQRLAMPALPAGALVGRTATVARVDLASGWFTPYFWSARVPGDAWGGWQRVTGVETRLGVDRLPIVPLPRADIVGGAGYAIDRPHKGRLTAYLTVGYRP